MASSSTSSSLEENIAILSDYGYTDVEKNRQILLRFNNRLDKATNFILDHGYDTDRLPLMNPHLPRRHITSGIYDISQSTPKNGTMSQNGFDPYNICQNYQPHSKKPVIAKKPKLSEVQTETEECPICCNEYGSFVTSPTLWKELTCSHKLCLICYQTIESSGTTMSGVVHTFVRCPFCQSVSGIQVGDCPDGKMTVEDIPSSCEGYPDCESIQVTYRVNSGQYHLHRTGYLPDNEEGNKALKLLRVAWDRRLCFVIGNSLTTGRENVLVWNIHHKTSLGGGVKRHGYPDPEYIQRLMDELKGYGIEENE